MLTKFHGKFKDLIPHGFKFQKLFAKNYRQYAWTDPNNQYGDSIHVWQHHGGYVEINDLGHFSRLIFNAFADYSIDLDQFLNTTWNYYKFIVNRKTYQLEVYDSKKHNYMHLYYLEQDGKITKEQMDSMHKEMIETYREVIISKNSWLHHAILSMIEKGWIKY